MGGGFYDLLLQNWQNKSLFSWFSAPMSWSRENLPTEHWDVPVWYFGGLKPIIKILLIDKIKIFHFSLEIYSTEAYLVYANGEAEIKTEESVEHWKIYDKIPRSVKRSTITCIGKDNQFIEPVHIDRTFKSTGRLLLRQFWQQVA